MLQDQGIHRPSVVSGMESELCSQYFLGKQILLSNSRENKHCSLSKTGMFRDHLSIAPDAPLFLLRECTMFTDALVTVPGGRIWCRETHPSFMSPAVLLVHGLGESGLSFLEAFGQPLLDRFSLLAPDLLGFGKSDDALDNDYSFNSHIARLLAVLDQKKIHSFHLIGHSMGGDIGTLLCEQAPDRVLSFINIEGDLDPSDRFITNAAIQAEQEGRFEEWLRHDFTRGTVHSWAAKLPATARYAASLEMCRTEAFRQGAHEIYSFNEAIPGGTIGIIGDKYQRLGVKRVFCWGQGLSAASRKWLAESSLLHLEFEQANHWLMIDQPDAFYGFAAGFWLSQS